MSSNPVIALESIATAVTGDTTFSIARPRAIASRPSPTQSRSPFSGWLLTASLTIETQGTRPKEEPLPEADPVATLWGDLAPMPELHELRLSSFEQSQRFGFPYNVPDEYDESEGEEAEEVVVAASPPAWLLAHAAKKGR